MNLIFMLMISQTLDCDICQIFNHVEMYLSQKGIGRDDVFFVQKNTIYSITDGRLVSFDSAKEIVPVSVEYDEPKKEYTFKACESSRVSGKTCVSNYGVSVVAAKETLKYSYYLISVHRNEFDKDCNLLTGLLDREYCQLFYIYNPRAKKVEHFRVFSFY